MKIESSTQGELLNQAHRPVFADCAVLPYICDYFGIEPADFFDFEATDPGKTHELVEAAKTLDSDQMDSLIRLVRGLRK